MEPSIYKYILTYSRKDQLYLLILTAISLPFVYFSLDIPKLIINQAIGGEGMPEALLGIELDQISYLMVLCFVFLGLVILNGAFKYVINVYRGVLGERMLRRFRYQLYTRVLRFPLPHFKHISQGEIIPMITAETEPLGGFIGDAFALPAFQGGILFTYLFFIFNQDVLLGLVATGLYPFQIYIIPKLQKRVNLLGKQRVRTVRKLAERIGESISGVTEIHTHDTSHFERADIGSRLGTLFGIRFEIYKRKFFIKFLNNFLAQVAPFFFYSVGGYFVIKGELSLGALVAVLGATKDLASPWKELLKYYQIKEDVRVKYEQIIEQFQPPNMLALALQDQRPKTVEPLRGELASSNLSYSEDGIVKVVDGAALQINLDQHVAVVGPSGSGKDELAQLLARLLQPTGGRIKLAEQDLAELSEAVLGRGMAYVGQNAHLFAASIRDNLFYSLKHQPIQAPNYTALEAEQHQQELHRAVQAGNSIHDVHADWINYADAGVEDRQTLEEKAIDLLGLVEMQDDIYRLGLHSTIDPQRYGALAGRLLEARTEFRRHLSASDTQGLVEPFDEDRYNSNASVAENLLFGMTNDPSVDVEQLAHHPYVNQILTRTGLLFELQEIGRKIAETMVDLFADLPPDHHFFEQFSFISSDDLPEYQVLLGRIAGQSVQTAKPDEQARLLSLTFKMIPARHRLGLLDAAMRERLVEARRAFARDLPEELRSVVEFFSADKYNAAATLQDNILFGKRAYGQAQAQARVGELIRKTVDTLDLRRDITHIGLDYEVGINGSRLSPVQRQKLAIVRSLLKNPDVLILNEAISGLDASAETRVLKQLLEHMQGRGLIWMLSRVDLARRFDRVLVIDAGKIIEQGTFSELENSGTVFKQLLRTQ